MKSILMALISATAIFAQAHQGHVPPSLAGHLVFKNKTVHIHVSFSEKPAVGKPAALKLETKTAGTHEALVLTDKIEVILWMPSMGHGSAPTQVQRATDSLGQILNGVYDVKNVFFIMDGDWEVRVVLTDSEGRQEMKSFMVKLADSSHGGGHH